LYVLFCIPITFNYFLLLSYRTFTLLLILSGSAVSVCYTHYTDHLHSSYGHVCGLLAA